MSPIAAPSASRARQTAFSHPNGGRWGPTLRLHSCVVSAPTAYASHPQTRASARASFPRARGSPALGWIRSLALPEWKGESL